MVFISKKQLKTALKETSRSQRGQSVESIMSKAREPKKSGYEAEKFLKAQGMSTYGAKEVRKSLEKPAQPKPEFRKPESQKIRQQQLKEKQPQKGTVKPPEWIKEVGHTSEESTQTGFGGQQGIQRDVRVEKAGQAPMNQQRQSSSNVDRTQTSQEEVDRLEQQSQQDYVDKSAQSKRFEDLDQKDNDEAAKIDAMLGGGGGETGGGKEK